MQENVELLVGGRRWSGWKAVRVTRGVEIMPSSFQLAATENYPGDAPIAFAPFDKAELLVGGEPLVTGWIDDVDASIDPHAHSISVSGRGKCADLVDCSAELTAAQFNDTPAEDIIRKIAKIFDISVVSLSGPGKPIRAFDVNLMQTAWSIIEPVARYSNLLAYEGRDGNLILSAIGQTKMASGIVYGLNAQALRLRRTAAERFSKITVVLVAVDTFWQITPGAPPGISQGNTAAVARDLTVPRFRPRVIVSEQTDGSRDFALARASWEIARRYGRSQAMQVVVDSWRDSSGALWAPNARIAVNVPPMQVISEEWVISEVSFLYDLTGGTRAELTVMPKEAFEIQPSLLYAFDRQLADQLRRRDGEAPR